MEARSRNLAETERIAARFIKGIASRGERSGAVVVGLSGELGAGKTAFAQAVAKALGISQTVASPTFVILKIYKLSPSNYQLQTKNYKLPLRHLVHIDAYRLNGDAELKALGWDDIVADPQNLVLIEWPENVKEIFPQDAVLIEFETSGEYERKLYSNFEF